MLRRSAAIFCVFAVALLCRAESPDKLPKPTSYVADYAGVVDAGSRQSVEDICRQVNAKAHATIIVATVHSLDGLSIEDFTTRLEDNWKVGPKSTDKGVLFVFAIEERKRRIEVGYGLEGILNDAKVGDIGRDMVPQLREGQYGPAIQTGVQEVANVIAADAGITLDAPQPHHTYHREPARSGGGFPWIWVAVVLFFLLFAGRGGRTGMFWFLLGNLLGSGRGGGRWDNDDRGGGFGGGSGGGGNDSDFGGGFGGSSGGGGASGDW